MVDTIQSAVIPRKRNTGQPTGMTAAIRTIKVGECLILLGKVHRVSALANNLGKRSGRTFACRTISETAVRVWRLS